MAKQGNQAPPATDPAKQDNNSPPATDPAKQDNQSPPAAEQAKQDNQSPQENPVVKQEGLPSDQEPVKPQPKAKKKVPYKVLRKAFFDGRRVDRGDTVWASPDQEMSKKTYERLPDAPPPKDDAGGE